MLRLLRPALITVTFAVPTASYALGLGDIHIQSALHQPLVAQIELVGVQDDELSRVSATLASDELFEKYNLERAPFIYGTTLSVGRDAQGRPVLNMRSTEKFVEPVVTLLVDVHTPSGELVREYTLFLDPAGLVDNGGVASKVAATSNAGVASNATAASNAAEASNVPVASNASAGPNAPVTSNTALASNAAAASRSASKVAGPDRAASASPGTSNVANTHAAPASAGAGYKLLGTTYTVARRDTLARIVTATGAHSRVDRHRMMIAIYRANPAAFQNNFNRMHTGVTLTFPTAEQVAAISVDETNREYDAQMAAWRASLHRGTSIANTAAPNAAASAANNAGSSGVPAPGSATLPTDPVALTRRIASLEQSLAEVQRELKRPLPVPPPVAATTASAPAAATQAPATTTNGSAAPVSAPHDADRAAAPTSASHDADHSSAAVSALHDADRASTSTSDSHEAAPSDAASQSARISHAASAPAAATQSPEAVVDDAASDDDEDEAPRVKHRGYLLIAIGIGAGLLFFAGSWFYLRRRSTYAYQHTPRYPLPVATAVATASDEDEADSDDSVEFSTPPPPLPMPQKAAASSSEPEAPKPEQKQEQPAAKKDAKTAASWFEDSFSTPIADLLNDPTVSLEVDETAQLPFETIEATVQLPKPAANPTANTEVLVAPELEFAGDTVEQKFAFFNPEATTNTEHVVMGDALTEAKPFVERRKNPADVLRQAIEREPDRSDLRLKLLELYYTAAAENRRAFLEATRQLAKKETLATPEDWSRIADMGRIIAPDDKLFSADVDDDQRVA